jgi:predicted AAA+ superfamily ATPase
MFNRRVEKRIKRYLRAFPVVTIIGPRQIGKTTTAKAIQQIVDKDSIYLDLESDEDLMKIEQAEQYFNDRKEVLIIMDEIQRKPELFSLLRSVIDKKRQNGRFILLGSASPELLTQSSETLAGRIAYIEMHPLQWEEVKADYNAEHLWLAGGFPDFLMQKDSELSLEMRMQFIQTYIERELPLLGLSVSPIVLKNLLRMVAHYQAQLLNYSDLARSLGVDINTVKRYLDYFENAFLIRRLQPYFTNSGKRIVKSPKIFIRDTGLLHALFSLENKEDLDGFPGKGNSWESFVIQQVISALKPGIEYFFYRTQDGTELDLILVKGGKPCLGLEIKLSNAPKLTKGTTLALRDLGDIPVLVVTPSVSEDYKHSENITITDFARMFMHLYKLELTDR